MNNKIRFRNRLVIIRMLLLIILFNIPKHILAQQNRVDSILGMIEACMPDNKLDSIKLNQITNLLWNTALNDSQIASIEKQSALLDKGADQDLSFMIRLPILSNLTRSNFESAIKYGQKTLHELETRKSPQARRLRDLFLSLLRIPYRNSNQLEEGIQYFNARLKDFKTFNDSSGLATVHYVLSGFYNTTGLNDEAIYHLKKANTFTNEDPDYNRTYFGFIERNSLYFEIQNLGVISKNYYDKGDMEQARDYGTLALEKAKKMDYNLQIPYLISNIIEVKLATNELTEIPGLLKTGMDTLGNTTESTMGVVLRLLEADYYTKINSFDKAESIITDCWTLVKKNNFPVVSASGNINPDYYLALLRIEQNRINEAIELLDKDIIRLGNLRFEILKNYQLQSTLYEKLSDFKNAFLVNKKYLALQKEIQSDADKFRRVSFEVEQEMNQKELSIAALQSENRIASITQKFTIGLAIMFILLAGAIYYRFQSKKKANAILEATLTNLKSTQSQLIQSEKMASLGELTAGIAHEIQNPLNFVNNFSEVSSELVDETLEQVEAVKTRHALSQQQDSSQDKESLTEIKDLLGGVKSNLEKINHHGQRASSIVKGMLEHSRVSTGEKVPTNINALADEYLRLAFHGLRAKDKSFNAELKTDYDETIGSINNIPQDIGRVLLNLINNAFYAVNERRKKGEDEYEPRVTVNTWRAGSPLGVRGERGKADYIQISIKDNGNGIPDSIKDKIFQPFFTTKPTGQGTGLGLSLSYDIVKAHGGELKVESDEGKGTEFIIQIPKS